MTVPKPKKKQHVFLEPPGTFFCSHCGERYAMTIPAPIGVMVAACKAYSHDHRHCKPNPAVAAHEQKKLDDSFKSPEAWINGPDTGLSSKTIWRVMMDLPPIDPSVPRDPSDFGRCYRLLKAFPMWRPRMPEVAIRHPEWAPHIREWERMTAIYERDEPTGRSEELYDLLLQLDREPSGVGAQ